MKFYLIGKFATRETIGERIKVLESLGHECAHNWTKKENYTAPKSEQVYKDLMGVTNAELVIAVIDNPNYHYRGSFAEIGCALGQGKRVHLITNNCEKGSVTHCFLSHKNIIKFSTWEGFLDYIKDMKCIN